MIRAALVALGVTALPAAAAECEDVSFDGAGFTVCRIDPATEDVRLFLRDEASAPYASFRSVNRALEGEGRTLGVAMNAGMYHTDRSPVGLYVEGGETEREIVTTEGPGNFGLLPNGVLCLSEDRAQVIESRTFAADPPDCTYATQSGPMLVIDGELHPRFLADSDSTFIRNGAGVGPGGTLYLAISNEAVNFHTFGRLFRDELGVQNALYFDGNISRLYDSGSGRHDAGWPMGPIIGTVTED
ncbi:phosphodiester glycosidase family protein [Palleronia sp.]|uniref:phosphodiester glycosidase family protein n=1 Tax=Palleronia sp. TaxID=1940284 RepID=UPI0035C84B69